LSSLAKLYLSAKRRATMMRTIRKVANAVGSAVGSRQSARQSKRKAASQAVDDDAEVVEVDDSVPGESSGRNRGAGPSNAGRSVNNRGSDDEDDERAPDLDKTARKYAAVVSKMDAENQKPDLSNEEVEKLVSAVMRHMLFKQPAVLGLTTREDLTKLINKNYQGRRNLSNYIIAVAQAQFPHAFGLEMKEIEKAKKKHTDPKKKLAAVDAAPAKMYVLRSLLPTRYQRRFVQLVSDKEEMGFTLLVLALIVTSINDQILEDALWEHLEEVGIIKGRKHPKFGDPEALLQKLVKERYVAKDKVRTPEGEKFQFEIGESAKDQIPREEIQRFISDMMMGAEEEDGEEVVID